MKIEVVYNRNTKTQLPSNQFMDSVRTIIARHNQTDANLEKLKDRIRTLMIETKLKVPTFKPERWFLILEKGIFTIRYGDNGDPQITITEKQENLLNSQV